MLSGLKNKLDLILSLSSTNLNFWPVRHNQDDWKGPKALRGLQTKCSHPNCILVTSLWKILTFHFSVKFRGMVCDFCFFWLKHTYTHECTHTLGRVVSGFPLAVSFFVYFCSLPPPPHYTGLRQTLRCYDLIGCSVDGCLRRSVSRLVALRGREGEEVCVRVREGGGKSGWEGCNGVGQNLLVGRLECQEWRNQGAKIRSMSGDLTLS